MVKFGLFSVVLLILLALIKVLCFFSWIKFGRLGKIDLWYNY